ncbi:hypothetical protein V8G54_027526 [Vigna mungo]|uniref:RING-type domain-containing protein n=1 Tax=Vigna mungo TaxID=3915 RepID=A0AAQ3RP65_VIGMU
MFFWVMEMGPNERDLVHNNLHAWTLATAFEGVYARIGQNLRTSKKLPRLVNYGMHGQAINCGECAICLEEFQANELCQVFPMCKHIFHSDCINHCSSDSLAAPSPPRRRYSPSPLLCLCFSLSRPPRICLLCCHHYQPKIKEDEAQKKIRKNVEDELVRALRVEREGPMSTSLSQRCLRAPVLPFRQRWQPDFPARTRMVTTKPVWRMPLLEEENTEESNKNDENQWFWIKSDLQTPAAVKPLSIPEPSLRFYGFNRF